MKLQPSFGTSNHFIPLVLISLCGRHLTLIRESITSGLGAQENEFTTMLPGDTQKCKQEQEKEQKKEQIQRTLDRDLVKKKLSECVVKYTDKSFFKLPTKFLCDN